jgi:hypothetical protein
VRHCAGAAGETLRLGIHDGATGERLYSGAPKAIPLCAGGTGPQYYITDDAPSVLVTAGQSIYVGGAHNSEIAGIFNDASFGSGREVPSSGTNTRMTFGGAVGQVPLDIIPDFEHFSGQSFVEYFHEPQVIPLVPQWISPTPANNGTIANPTPTLRFTLPHGTDAEFDSSLTVDIELTVLNTGAFHQWTQAVSATDKANGYFSWTPLTFAPGDQISVRVRHNDQWEDFSEWSTTRVFTILDAPPGKGAWITPPTPAQGSLVTDSTPDIRGTTPHPGADGAYDYTHGIQVQVVDEDTGVVIQDHLFAPTLADRNNDIFNFTLPAIAQNTNAKVRFRHHDRGGTWSPEWSDYRSFTISAGPDAPSVTNPVGKANYRNQTEFQAQGGVGDLYKGSYNNISGTAMHSVRIEIWNAAASARLYDSGWVARTATAGVWTLPQASFPGHPASLAWGTTYQIRAKVAETNAGVRGIESEWGPFAILTTNSFPNRPTALSPSNGIPISTQEFTAEVTDPDGDVITEAEMVIKRVDNGATVAGSPFTMVVSGNSLSRTLPGGTLTLGVEYQWFCRASDETGYGQDSFVEPFVYASVPQVDMLAPALGERVNVVRDASAEYQGPTFPYWTTLSSGAGDTIERSGEDFLYGDFAWKGTTSATNDLTFRGETHTIDATKAWLLQAEFAKLSGTSNTRLRLRCMTSAGTFISNVTPTSISGAGGVDIPLTWTRKGGIIWPIGSGKTPAFPATTAKVAIEILPSDDALAEVFFDGVCFEQLPTDATSWTTGQWTEVQKFYGFFDGDTPNHTSRTDEYWFHGVQGETASQGDARLTSPAAKVYYRFTHSGAQQDARLLIDRWSDPNDAWVQIYDSGFVASAASSGAIVAVDLPPGVLLNDDRYRFRAQARDALGISGEGVGTIADTDYIGQPEPLITLISSDTTKAEVTLEWEETSLALEDFAGYEIARGLRDDPSSVYTVLHREMNRSVTRFTDPYPCSDINYVYMVRVIELVGIDERQGRWGKAPINVNYFPFSFVKDAEDPFNLYVAFDTALANMPTPEEDAIQQVAYPWGQARPTVMTRADMRIRSGTVVAEFHKDAPTEDAMTRYQRLRTILGRRRGIVLLTQEPDKERIFASVMGVFQRQFTGVEQRHIEFNYQENAFAEDLRERA